MRGDLNEAVVDLAAQAPPEATLVVFHSAVLAYLDLAGRETFTEIMRQLPGRWVSNESPGALARVNDQIFPSAITGRAVFALALDGQPLALAGPHGERLDWL